MPQVVALAVCAAFYPTLLAGVIVILTRPKPIRQLAAFYAGGLIISLAAGFALLLLFGGDLNSPKQPASAGADLVLGILTLLLAWLVGSGRALRLARSRRRTAPSRSGPSRVQRTLEQGSARIAFAVGLVLNLPGVWYLAALKQISTDNNGTAADVVLVLVFNLIMFTLVEVPLVGYVVAPERTTRAVDRFDAWLRGHAAQVGTTIALVVGCYLLVKGVIEAAG